MVLTGVMLVGVLTWYLSKQVCDSSRLQTSIVQGAATAGAPSATGSTSIGGGWMSSATAPSAIGSTSIGGGWTFSTSIGTS